MNTVEQHLLHDSQLNREELEKNARLHSST